jgi:hypothetical protein
MRTSAGWSDVCILNISSRGLLIHSGRAFPQGSIIELRHLDHVIVGRVVWRRGAKVGLQAEDRLAVDQILSLADSPGLSLTAAQHTPVERRRALRTHDQSRQRSRMIEFAGLALVGAAFSLGAVGMVERAFAGPLEQARIALGGD